MVAVALSSSAATGFEPPQWEVVSATPEPVIGPNQTIPHGVFQGFETGQYMAIDGVHYYVANELGLCENVTWDKTTRAALWSAPTGAGPWTRVTTLRNTNSMYTLCNLEVGKGLPNKCSWAPTLIYAPSIINDSKPVWNMFYSACDGAKDTPRDGMVYAVSASDSIEGPYVDVPGVAQMYNHAFTSWQLSNGTRMSFRNNVLPFTPLFSVGLERATADDGKSFGGPWAYDNNSIPFPCGPENPVVTRSADNNWYYAVYDALEQIPNETTVNGSSPAAGGCTEPSSRALCKSKTECDKIALAWSPDGVTWTANATTLIQVQTGGNHPCGQIRTPLGMVAEPELCKGCYSVLWTGYSTLKGTDRAGFTPVCHAVIRQMNE